MNFDDERSGQAKGKFKVLELGGRLTPESVVKFFFRIVKIYSIADYLTNSGVFGITIISFRDYSAVVLGFKEWKLVNVDFFETPNAKKRDPVTRILYEVCTRIKEDKIPSMCEELITFKEVEESTRFRHGDKVDPYQIERRWIRWISEACKRHLGEGLSERDVDRLIEWLKEWWDAFMQEYYKAVAAWTAFGMIGRIESFDEF